MKHVLAALAAVPLLYACSSFGPAQARDETPNYLAKMRADHLDQYVDAGDFRLHYLKIGQGDPVILLPGGGAWIYDMRELAERLARSHTVYVIDPPGDGYTTAISPHPDYRRLYTLGAVNTALLGFMDRLGLTKAAFAGNSWGGGYALYFAETHPDRVTKYISLDGTGLDLDDTGGSLAWKIAKIPVLDEVFFELGAGRSDVKNYLKDTLIHAPITDDMVSEYYIPYRLQANLISQS